MKSYWNLHQKNLGLGGMWPKKSKKEQNTGKLEEQKVKTFIDYTRERLRNKKIPNQGELTRETKSFICATQEQALQTNYFMFQVDKTCKSPFCSVNHIASACPNLEVKQDTKKHIQAISRVHWFLYRKYSFDCQNKAYKHIPKPALLNQKFMALQNTTDKEIEGKNWNKMCHYLCSYPWTPK